MKTRIRGAAACFALPFLAFASGAMANETVSATVFMSVYLEPVELTATQTAFAPDNTCVDAMQNGGASCQSGTTSYTLEEDPDSGTLIVSPI